MDTYYVLVFSFPNGGKSTLAKVRGCVVRCLERREQQILLLEDNFLMAVQAEKQRLGAGGVWRRVLLGYEWCVVCCLYGLKGRDLPGTEVTVVC